MTVKLTCLCCAAVGTPGYSPLDVLIRQESEEGLGHQTQVDIVEHKQLDTKLCDTSKISPAVNGFRFTHIHISRLCAVRECTLSENGCGLVLGLAITISIPDAAAAIFILPFVNQSQGLSTFTVVLYGS